MARRPFRVALVLFGLLVTAGLGYRAIDDERTLGRARMDGAALDRSAEEAAAALADLRATLHAYVAPGQGLPFWAGRSTTLLDTLRERLLSLDAARAASGVSLADSLDGIDQLSAAAKRAQAYAGRGDLLLAGDVIFTEIRDLLAAAGGQVSTARNALRRDSDRRAAGIRQEQAALAVAAVALWAIIAFIMLPAPAPAAPQESKEWRQELATKLKKAETDAVAPALKPVAPAEPGPPVEPAEPGIPVAALHSVGEICTDMSALSDAGALAGALERAAGVLGASGLIVWIASNDGGSLSPVATHGFDKRLVARIGAIPRDGANLTAAAFRENAARVSQGSVSMPAAVAVSMCSPSGPVGVLSVELRIGRKADDACVALATIFAAQLATLALPVAAADQSIGEEAGRVVQADGARRAAL